MIDNMITPFWEHFAHEADVGVRGVATSKEAAFEQAALAVTAIVTQPEKVAAKERIEFSCEAPDDELLLVDWLNAVIFEMATRRMLFSRFKVKFAGHALTAQAWGEPLNPEKHPLGVEVKGATYTMLQVKQRDDGLWCAQTVVDV